jgi:hypothetical protein
MAADSVQLLLWELHGCYKKYLLARLQFTIDMAMLPCAFTWSPDGMLLIADATGSVFLVLLTFMLHSSTISLQYQQL